MPLENGHDLLGSHAPLAYHVDVFPNPALYKDNTLPDTAPRLRFLTAQGQKQLMIRKIRGAFRVHALT